MVAIFDIFGLPNNRTWPGINEKYDYFKQLKAFYTDRMAKKMENPAT